MMIFLPDAKSDILDSARYYQAQLPGLEERFLEAVQDGLQRVKTHPEAWTLVDPPSLRRCLLKWFPYGIYYRTAANQCIVIAVGHLSRKPGYWKKRRSLP